MDKKLYKKLEPTFMEPSGSEMDEGQFYKRQYAIALLDWCGDSVMRKFFDPDSDKMLDTKIDVLERLTKGESPEDIGENYYRVMENYPRDSVGERTVW